MPTSRRILLALLGAIALLGSARAADTAPVIVEVLVPAAVARVWQAYATREGQEAWMVAHADVDLRIGGLMRAHYDPKGQLGDAGTIENRILAFEPERMVTIRVARAPATFPFPSAVKSMWTVVYFTPLGAESTWVRAVSLGIPDDDEGRRMRAFFERGNRWTLERLAGHFAAKPADAAPR